MTRCANCQTPLDPKAKFCTSCGAPARQGVPSSRQQGMMQCSNCGMSIPHGARFCTKCGKMLMSLEIQPSIPGKDRAKVIESKGRFMKWNQRVWDIVTMVGSVAAAIIWYSYTTIKDKENQSYPDMTTSVAIVALPLVLIIFRPLIDRLLMPLHRIKKKIPPMVLLGLGLAMPFLVTSILYSYYKSPNPGEGVFPNHYTYMVKAYVFSALASFVILRNPPPKGTFS